MSEAYRGQDEDQRTGRTADDDLQRDDAHGDAAASAADRNAKIEELLLLGLDHYFAGQYEQAINVWTRTLFLDRLHPRARAYIERARSALAERQRESEELLQNGVDAFHRGEGDQARRLLQAAIDGGAPADEALAVLERLKRLEPHATTGVAARARSDVAPARAETVERQPKPRRRTGLAVVAMLAFVALGGYLALSAKKVDVGLLLTPPPGAAPSGVAVPDPALPLPTRGEMALARARALAAGGHLHDALTSLNDVRATDAQRDEADRLRAQIQRELLSLTPMPAPLDRLDHPERRNP